MASLISVMVCKFNEDDQVAEVESVDLQAIVIPEGSTKTPIQVWKAAAEYWLKDDESTLSQLFPNNNEPNGREFVSLVQQLTGFRTRSVAFIPDLEPIS